MSTDTTSEASNEASDKPIHIDGRADLDEVVATHEIVLTDFYANWCGPCKMLEPVVKTLAAQTDAAVAKVDVDANQQLAATYGVRGVPTLVLFVDGKQVEEVVGMQNESQLRSLIERYAK